MKVKLILSVIVCISCLRGEVLGEGEDNPTGVSGIYNGNITTAGNYDPYTRNVMRVSLRWLIVRFLGTLDA